MSTGLYMLADALLGALSAKIERDTILAKVRDMEAKGSTPDQITQALRSMRDEAIRLAQDEINRG